MSTDVWECPHGYQLDTCCDCDEEHAKEVASLRAQLTKVREALEPFVRQVEEFHAGRWDEVDWPVAIDSLTKLAEAARAALASHPSSPEAKEST